MLTFGYGFYVEFTPEIHQLLKEHDLLPVEKDTKKQLNEMMDTCRILNREKNFVCWLSEDSTLFQSPTVFIGVISDITIFDREEWNFSHCYREDVTMQDLLCIEKSLDTMQRVQSWFEEQQSKIPSIPNETPDFSFFWVDDVAPVDSNVDVPVPVEQNVDDVVEESISSLSDSECAIM